MPLNVDKISTGSLSVNGTDITGNAPYKVYTALLTQSGIGNTTGINSGPLTKGVTYKIQVAGGDFSNVGAPNNDPNTYFVAINNNTPISYGGSALMYNTGAPVVTVLENTIGNIWFEYGGEGLYLISNSDGWNRDKLWYGVSGLGDSGGININPGRVIMSIEGGNPDFLISTYNNDYTSVINGQLINTPIEIRVYN
jgi:hypothetical protein